MFFKKKIKPLSDQFSSDWTHGWNIITGNNKAFLILSVLVNRHNLNIEAETKGNKINVWSVVLFKVNNMVENKYKKK